MNRYGARLLYGGVDRDDVLAAIARSVVALAPNLAEGAEPEGIVVNAVRPNAFTAEQVAAWEADPLGACERVFPGSRALVEKYRINIARRPVLTDLGEGAARVGYNPEHHFGTFLEELRRLDAAGGEEAVRAMRCPY